MAANTLNFGSKVAFINGFPVTLPTATSDPGTAVTGDIYYNTVTNVIRVYNGTIWTTSTGGSLNKETFVLASPDISNGYIDLAHVAKTNSIVFFIQGGPPAIEGSSYDYSVNYTGGAGGNTRITFLNSLISGPGALVSGNVIQIGYQY